MQNTTCTCHFTMNPTEILQPPRKTCCKTPKKLGAAGKSAIQAFKVLLTSAELPSISFSIWLSLVGRGLCHADQNRYLMLYLGEWSDHPKKVDVDEVSVFPLLKQTFWDDITTYFTQIYHKISSTFQLMTLFLKNGHNMQHAKKNN